MDIINASPRVQRMREHALTNGWKDITGHYGDPDCDLTQVFIGDAERFRVRKEIEVRVTWKGEGVHKNIRSVEVVATAPFITDRADGILFFDSLAPTTQLEAEAWSLMARDYEEI